MEEEPDQEPVAQHEPVESLKKLPPSISKDAERQLSKKELKKKELAELDAVLAELGIAKAAAPQSDAPGTSTLSLPSKSLLSQPKSRILLRTIKAILLMSPLHFRLCLHLVSKHLSF